MKAIRLLLAVNFAMAYLGVCAAPAPAGTLPIITKCPPDAVLVGQTCVDTYEASVWQVPVTNGSGRNNAGLINKIKQGKAKIADLTAGNATQISVTASGTCSPAFPGTFPVNGNWTAPLYAVSIPGVHPTACVSWFQAEQACALAGKRLLTNQEWQRAAAGTPDNTDDGSVECNTSLVGDAVNTGSRANCKSGWGAFDMVGNVDEWVGDWVPLSTGCVGWGVFSDDLQCFAGADTSANHGPGVLNRGSNFLAGTLAGVFAIGGESQPMSAFSQSGFRCAR